MANKYFYFIKVFVSLIFIGLSLFAQEKPKNRAIISFDDSYWQVYGSNQELSIK